MKPGQDPLLVYLRRPGRRRLARVVKEYHQFVWDVAFRVTGNAEDAADICQDVFLKLLVDPPAAGEVSSPGGYLSWQVIGRAAALRRAEKRRRARESARLSALRGGPLSPEDLDALRQALDELPDELRAVMELRHLAGLQAREVAAMLGISERAVRLRAERAREVLKGRLAPLVSALFIAGGLARGQAAGALPADLLAGLLRIVERGATLSFPADAAVTCARALTSSSVSTLPSPVAAPAAIGALIMTGKHLGIGLGLSLLLIGGALYFLLPGGGNAGDGRAANGPARKPASVAKTPPAGEAPAAASARVRAAVRTETAGPRGAAEPTAERPISLAGRVIGADGLGAAGARLWALDLQKWEQALGDPQEVMGHDPFRGIRRLAESSRRAAAQLPATRSGADGLYALAGLPPGEYRLLVSHPDHLPHGETWVLVEKGIPARADVALTRGQTLAGKVVDDRGQPVAGASLFAEPSESARVKGLGRMVQHFLDLTGGAFLLDPGRSESKDDGTFRLSSLEPRLHDLRVQKPGFAETTARGVPPGAAGLEIRLSRGGVLVGRVLSPEREPLPGAELVLAEPLADPLTASPAVMAQAELDLLGEKTVRAKTSGDGRFALRSSWRGGFELTVRARGFPLRRQEVKVRGGEIDLGDIVLGAPLSIAGTVLDPDGAPVGGARVWVPQARPAGARDGSVEEVVEMPALLETVSDAQGLFRLGPLEGGAYGVVADHPAFLSGSAKPVEAGMEDLAIALAKGLTVTGTVLDAADRAPIDGAIVLDASGSMRKGTSDAEGRFTIAGLGGGPAPTSAGGQVELRIRHEGYQDAVQAFPPSGAAGAPPPEVLLSRPPQAAGIVRDREGKPVRGARISLEIPEIPGGFVALVAGGAQRAVYSDEEGRFSVGIPQKPEKMSYQVVATHPGFAKGRSRPLEASPPSGGWQPVEIVLTPGAALGGKVTDAAGRPVASALVRARTAGAALDPEVAGIAAQLPAAPAGDAAYSGEDGGYRLSALGPGSYSVEVTALGYARKTIPAVSVGEEDARLDVVLQSGGRLSGRVVDTDAEPLPDIEVVAFLVLEVVSEAEEELAPAARSLKQAGGLGVAAAKTDRDGRYELLHLPEGEFELVARARGYTPSARGPLRAGEEAPDLMLSARSRLSGQVLDAATRAPVSPFAVQLIPKDGEFSDPEAGRPASFQEPEGRFLYPELPAGRYEVLVEAGDSAPALESVQLAPGKEETVEVLMRPGFSIEGFVRCRSTGLPIAKASVRVDPAGEEWRRRGFFRNALSGEDGRFILRGLPEGEFRTTARHPQYYRDEDSDPQRLSFPGAEALPLEIGMRPAGRLAFRVQPPLEAPQGSLEVSLRWLREPGTAVSAAGAPREEESPAGATFRAKAWLGPDGEYSMESLRPGVYAVEIERIGPARAGEVEVGAGRTETLEIERARQ